MDIGSISGTDYGGFNVKLTDRELYFLRAAGIPPHMLNNNDRACVIRALMVDNELIEDHKAGGYASLVYKMGSLRDMLSHTQEEIAQEELDAMSDLTWEEQEMKSQGYSKEDILALRRRRREEQAQLVSQRRLDIEEARSEEEYRMKMETQLFMQSGAARYAEMNPLPPMIIGALLTGQLGGLANQVKLDDDGMAQPITERLHPDITPAGRAARQTEQGAIDSQSIAMNSRSITMQQPAQMQSVAMEGRSITIQQVVGDQSLAEQPAMKESVDRDSGNLPFKITVENVKDGDPTQLRAPMPERKVQHEAPSLSSSNMHNKGEK